MTNHPNRAAQKPYIAFSTVTHNSLAWGQTAQEARQRALEGERLEGDAFLEILACGENGRRVWAENLPLASARALNKTVFRGAGDAPHLPPIDMLEN